MPSAEFQRLNKKLHAYPFVLSEDPADHRAGLERAASFFTVDKSVRVEAFDLDGIPAEWLVPDGADSGRTLIYFHGGGYMMGSINSHRHLVGDLAKAAGMRALAIDYRLAPEHPFPAGLDDAVKTYRWVLEQGVEATQLVVAGDSAGGGLTLATLLSLRDAGDPLPAAAVLMSPWTDLTGSGESMRTKDDEDPILRAETLPRSASRYAGGEEISRPLISPLFADLTGLPPLQVLVGTAEILLDDSLRLAERAVAAGVDVDLDVWDDMLHIWPYYAQWIPEGRDAISRMATFMQRHAAG
jgi:epsilon-lactone hydrolase